MGIDKKLKFEYNIVVGGKINQNGEKNYEEKYQNEYTLSNI